MQVTSRLQMGGQEVICPTLRPGRRISLSMNVPVNQNKYVRQDVLRVGPPDTLEYSLWVIST